MALAFLCRELKYCFLALDECRSFETKFTGRDEVCTNFPYMHPTATTSSLYPLEQE